MTSGTGGALWVRFYVGDACTDVPEPEADPHSREFAGAFPSLGEGSQSQGDLVARRRRGSRADHACRVTGRHGTCGWQLGKEAAQAGTLPGQIELRMCLVADCTAVDPGRIGGQGEVVDQEACRQIVGAVENEIGALCEPPRVASIEVGDFRLNVNPGVHASQVLGRGDGLGRLRASVGFCKSRLAVEVAPLDHVSVDEGKIAHPRPCEKLCGVTTQGAAADDKHMAFT